jgi:hypothetical protein
VRQLFLEIKGRDPAGVDGASLRRWVASPFGTAEIARRLRAERPLIGVHYFAWYRDREGGWGNDATLVAPGAPKPVLGWYDSGDPSVMDVHIAQMSAAGFDFAVVNLIVHAPDSWDQTRQFFNRLRRGTLKAAVMLDGLNGRPASEKAQWIEKAVRAFTPFPNYLTLHGRPLVALFSAPADVAAPDVTLRNVYWTRRYEPGANTFNPGFALDDRDWPFWAPFPQPIINGVVPVIPGYGDTHLGRERRMEHPRRDGTTYHEQWQRALALRPELILVYSWNEHFEETAIEPTDTWGDRYMRWTACYAAHARRGTSGAC